MKNFNKAKNNRPRRRWYTIRIKNYEVYLWGLPFIPFVLFNDYIKDRRYKRLEWSEVRASRVLTKVLPNALEWVEEDSAFYYNMDWSTTLMWRKCRRIDRAWAKKYAYKIQAYLKDAYTHSNYVKTVESDGYDTWIKFEEK